MPASEDAAPPPPVHRGSRAHARPARAHGVDPLRAARPVQDERAVLLLSARAGFRRARPEARRPLPLRHRDPAAAVGIRDPRHGAALEIAIRMGRARRIAEQKGIKAATIRDLRAGRKPKGAPKDERAIYEFIQELYKTRRVSERTYKRVQCDPGRRRHRRAGRHPRLLRDGRDDAQRLPHAGRPEDDGAVRGAGSRAPTEAIRRRWTRRSESGDVGDAPDRAAPAAARRAAAACGRGLLTRWSKSSRKRSCGIGGAISTPWPKSQPITMSACRSAGLSMPFGDRRAAEAVREIDRGLADRRIGGVGRAVAARSCGRA